MPTKQEINQRDNARETARSEEGRPPMRRYIVPADARHIIAGQDPVMDAQRAGMTIAKDEFGVVELEQPMEDYLGKKQVTLDRHAALMMPRITEDKLSDPNAPKQGSKDVDEKRAGFIKTKADDD